MQNQRLKYWQAPLIFLTSCTLLLGCAAETEPEMMDNGDREDAIDFCYLQGDAYPAGAVIAGFVCRGGEWIPLDVPDGGIEAPDGGIEAPDGGSELRAEQDGFVRRGVNALRKQK